MSQILPIRAEADAWEWFLRRRDMPRPCRMRASLCTAPPSSGKLDHHHKWRQLCVKVMTYITFGKSDSQARLALGELPPHAATPANPLDGAAPQHIVQRVDKPRHEVAARLRVGLRDVSRSHRRGAEFAG
jgi:hypothetical protein